jgi:hypothetical protein
MSNTQPRYYVLKPVSEKPEKDGWYFVRFKGDKNTMQFYVYSDFRGCFLDLFGDSINKHLHDYL